MKLIIGLGNFGKEYNNTRHNVGFMCLDRFAAVHDLNVKKTTLFLYYKYDDSILIMPKTYMNRSGEAYKSAISRFKSIENVLVIMDDIDLPIGQLRLRNSGGDGGHNGLKSVLSSAETKDIQRLRIGIGRINDVNPKDYVLDKFSQSEIKTIQSEIELLVKWLEIYVKSDFNSLLNEYSKWKKKPIPSQVDGIK